MRQWIRRLIGRDGDGPLDCHAVGELLQQYLDGHVDAERARRISEHLEDCRRCGLEAETYQRIKAALAARRPTVPAESLARLRQFGARLAGGGESWAT